MGRITSHLPLLLILLIFTLLTLYHAIVLPLGEADDETDHYQYLRFVARTGHPPFTESERGEAGFKGGLAPLYYWLTAWPVALVGEQSLPDVRRVDARPERHIPSDGLGINHVLHTLDEQWPFGLSLRTKPWRGQPLAWRLVRFLSLPLAWVTITASYILARRLYPEPKIIAVGAAAFVAFLPRFIGSSAVINDDNLVFTLTSLLLLVQVMILQNTSPSPRLFALFGALFGLALITKYFSLILVPEVIFTLWVSLASQRRTLQTEHNHPSRITHHVLRFTSHPRRSPLAAFLAALGLTAGPWFAFILLRFNRIGDLGLIPGLAASLGEPQITEGLVSLLSGQPVRPIAATYSLFEWFGLLYRSFWFEYGWMQIFAPGWVYALFTVLLLCALAGHILHVASFSRDTHHTSQRSLPLGRITLLLTLHFLLFLIVVVARYILSATVDTGQGRHLYPALAVIALFVSLGLYYFGQQVQRILPAPNYLLSSIFHLPSSMFYLLSTIFFLLPAFILQPSSFILPHYDTLPVTITPPADLPIAYRHNLPFAEGLALAGFDTPTTVSAGEALPVTLYWRAEREARQDYLVSLCLQDDTSQPVACWAGHFANGRYPARAWEAGDTLAETVFIPIPTCFRLPDQRYRLHLELWPLAPDSPEPLPVGPPVLQQTFAEPLISIRAASPPSHLSQPVEVWSGHQRLDGSTSLQPGQALTWLDTTNPGQNQPPRFIRRASGAFHAWPALPAFSTALFLPCADSPEPFAQAATFIAGPTLPPGSYAPDSPAAPPTLSVSLNLRQRAFAPLTSTLVFSPYLAPLSLEIPGQPPRKLEGWKDGQMEESPNPPAFEPTAPYGQSSNLPPLPLQPSSLLPITLRWQARRWMADPLIVSLKLLDKDFQVGGERQATLGDRYPNVLWVPGEVVEETYPLRLNPDAPPGLYRLEISLLRQDKTLPDGYENIPLTAGETDLGHNLYPAIFRLLDPADGTPPPFPFSAQLGDSIQLTGFDLKQLSIVNSQRSIINRQEPISLILYWQSTGKIAAAYTVFTQLVGPDGQVWAQWDNPPQAGRYPTSAWAEQDSVVDRYTLTLRDGAPPGQYRLLAGMYDPATGQRLPTLVNGQPQPDNAVVLTTLSLAP
ncbi:MAG: glycosyltransferase family 39 protein [Anaerolineales bacterium]|nr:glycosyltransferase family 39 protein [Anaerolineales bacterium]